MNVDVDGTLNEVYFNFTGNDVRSKGDFAIKYDDIKVTIYKKKQPQEEKQISFCGWEFICEKRFERKIREAEVEVERIPEKSFYNFSEKHRRRLEKPCFNYFLYLVSSISCPVLLKILIFDHQKFQ